MVSTYTNICEGQRLSNDIEIPGEPIPEYLDKQQKHRQTLIWKRFNGFEYLQGTAPYTQKYVLLQYSELVAMVDQCSSGEPEQKKSIKNQHAFMGNDDVWQDVGEAGETVGS